MRMQNRPKGNFIESAATAFLMRNGFTILARNYAYRGGELDIVARDGDTIVFVEVKSVWSSGQGNPASRVNIEKQKKIWKTACHFLSTKKEFAPMGLDSRCRFDVLSVKVHERPFKFEYFKNAFESSQVIPQC